MYVFKELRRRQVRLDKRGTGEKAHVSVRELHQVGDGCGGRGRGGMGREFRAWGAHKA